MQIEEDDPYRHYLPAILTINSLFVRKVFLAQYLDKVLSIQAAC